MQCGPEETITSHKSYIRINCLTAEHGLPYYPQNARAVNANAVTKNEAMS